MFKKLLVALIFSSSLAMGVYAISKDVDHEKLRAAQPDIQTRSKSIVKELDSIAKSDLPADHWAREWAGSYYVGDGLGMNVRILIAPDAGVTYTWHGCMGLYDGNHGDIAETFDLDKDGQPDGLKINWKLNLSGGYHYDSKLFYFVRWDDPASDRIKRYIVPEEQMLEVVNDYNQGGYSRDSMYSAPKKYEEGDKIRRGWHPDYKPFEGVPQLPAKWAKLLILKAVDAKVTHVTPITTRNVTKGVDATLARVTFDKGSADGLYMGMEVRVSHGRGTLTIDKLQEHTAEAAFQAFTSAGEIISPPVVDEVIRVIHGKENEKAESKE